jgi:hypothetical protein
MDYRRPHDEQIDLAVIVGGGYLNGTIPTQCDENDPQTKAVIAGQRK